jgi:glycerophosphoryl diester phosphodiesterase
MRTVQPTSKPAAGLVLRLLSFILLSQPMFAQTAFDWQGHRGARGLLPENSIPAFRKALDLGVTTLELDVVVSKDKQVVVSHEPFFSADICTDPSGKPIAKGDEKSRNLYTYTYAEIQGFDCGSRGNPRFPEQQKQKVAKPLLGEVIRSMEAYRREKNLPAFRYSIEIKSTPAGDNVYHPGVAEFSDLVHRVITEQLSPDRFTLQCFDFRVLRYWHEKYPAVTLVALVENMRGAEKNLADLGFTPAVYSPYYQLLTGKDAVDAIHRLGMKVIPWTVNDPDDMRRLKAWGVDGIITDYPDRIRGL